MWSPMALSWLSEKECLRLEALVDEAEWTASLQDRVAALPKLPLDLDPFLSSLDKKVGGFIASSSRGFSSGFKTPKKDKIFTDARTGRLQRGGVTDLAERREFPFCTKLHSGSGYGRMRANRLVPPGAS